MLAKVPKEIKKHESMSTKSSERMSQNSYPGEIHPNKACLIHVFKVHGHNLRNEAGIIQREGPYIGAFECVNPKCHLKLINYGHIKTISGDCYASCINCGAIWSS
jgi:hypothetical protein